MNLFTEVYDKSRELLKTKCFEDRWSNIEGKIKALLVDGGFSVPDAPVLDLIRQSLEAAAKGKPSLAEAVADEIIALSRPADTGYQDRAALLKVLKHIYFVERTGAQSIWVVDHPSAYNQWVYDKVTGVSKDTLKTCLRQDVEAFGAGHRAMFTSALMLARKISMDVCTKLAGKDADTVAKARKWFHDDTATDADVGATVATLLDGFKKIVALQNSNTIIFSDRPHRRTDSTNKAIAAVNSDDKMPIIYLYKPFLDYGRMDANNIRSQLWRCAKTIIHEISHKILDTDDHAYGHSGIKPGESVTVAQAIKNADSWGIFAIDVAGYLPSKVEKKAYS